MKYSKTATKSTPIKRSTKTKRTVHYVDNALLLKELIVYKASVIAAEQANKPRPVVSDYLGESIMKIATHLAYKPNFSNYCVDADTEALTKRGWLKYDQIALTDELLSYDQSTKRLTWSFISELYVNTVKDERMFHLTSQGIDALVTVGHKFLIEECGLQSVENLVIKNHLLLTGAPETSGQTLSYENWFIQLVGWAITEGYIRLGKRKHSLVIAQKKLDGVREITSCLREGNIPWKENTRPNGLVCFNITGQIVNNILAVISLKGKVLRNEFILKLTPEQRQLLIITMIKGDGSIAKNGTLTYCQKDKAHMDAFLFLCALQGIVTHVKRRIWETQFGSADMWYAFLYQKQKCFIEKINFHGATRSAGGDMKSIWKALTRPKREATILYNGIVWCPKTLYGTFICRRNGYAYLTGNTYREDMICDGIENCLQYIDNFDPKKSSNPFAYFTQIIYFAFVRRIQKEKRFLYTKYKIIEHANLNQETTDKQEHDTPRKNDIYAGEWSQEQMYGFIEDFENFKRKKRIRRKANAELLESVPTIDNDPSE